MTIECYYGGCKYHGCQTDPDEGPFCFEEECLATAGELIAFAAERRESLTRLQSISKDSENEPEH